MGPSHSLADTHIPYHVTSRPPTDEVEVPACQRCVFLTRHQSAKSCPRSRVAFPLIVSLPLPAPQHGRSGRDRGKLMTTIAIHPFSLLSYVSVLTRHVRLGRPVLPTWCRPSAKAAPLSRRSRLVAPRTARRPPPRLLEESIDQAPEEIEREKNRGIQRFGKRFEDGDHLAVIALQQVTIQLQSTLLEKLRNAVSSDDNEGSEFMDLVDAADLGRDRAITCLLELRQRLLVAQSVGNSGEQQLQVPRQQRERSTSNPRLASPTELPIRSSHESSLSPASVIHHRTWTRQYSTARDASGEEESVSGAEDGRSQQERVNRKPPASVPFQPPPTCDASDQSPNKEGIPKFNSSLEGEDNTSKIWGGLSEDRRNTVTSIQGASNDNSKYVPSSSGAMLVRSLSNTPSLVPSSYTHNASTSIPTPTPENDYLGFCKSAWKLQNGDRAKAFTKCKEFNDGWSQSNVYFLACAAKCAFAGHIPIDKIWTKTWTYEAKGIKLRWAFLAKSHVQQHKVKDHQYAFQCMFCVFLGEMSPVYHGTDVLLSHIAEVHRGQGMGDVILYKTKCIADHVADDEEEFDINLFPLSAREQATRKRSEILSDDLLAPWNPSKNSTDANDSVIASEPWNEGLSDFHWGGEMERVELE
ncbi:hypothetical protein M433DRAFT_301226 [Acidomyces richmondensis BFW]|nr:hypothetical protein M433DRAFT_301226 [Acidomyces richmondensis BFW]